MTPAAPLQISCVIPVHDGERYLGAALNSVRRQSHPPFEVIVVDDGSSDRSGAIAAAHGPPVRVLRQPRQGVRAARQAGIDAARGDFVALLDADDLWHPDKLARQAARFTVRPQIDVSLVMTENFWEPGLEQEEAGHRMRGKLRGAHHFSSLMARRELFAGDLRMDPRSPRTLDSEWFARAIELGLVLDVIAETLAHRRMHPNSLTHTAPNTDGYVDMVKASLDRRRARAAGGS